MPNANGQHTDAENFKALGKATKVGPAAKTISSKSAQAIALEVPTQSITKGELVDGNRVEAGK